MYRIKKTKKDIVKLEQRLFKDLKIKERDHLQEWIAKHPEILGEELLIIQKEYDGFQDTSERLDLLAVDKKGGLVIIENKLDDTGRDVVWQALKYTSYCSTLTNAQIIRIYQEYLDKWFYGQNAKENLLEFFEREEDDLLLNRNDQRIIFVANHYRKEVTSTVLWLLDHDVQIQCFRATPYSMDEEMFLQVEQIIPLPETTEYMISAKEKEKEERSKSKVVEQSEAMLVEFWGELKDRLAARGLNYLDRVSAKRYWHIGFSKGKGMFGFCIGRKRYRVELYFADDPDKHYIDAMAQHEAEIEQTLGPGIIWQRLEGKRASRIRYHLEENRRWRDRDNWEAILEAYIDTMERFYNALYPVWEKVQREV